MLARAHWTIQGRIAAQIQLTLGYQEWRSYRQSWAYLSEKPLHLFAR